MTFNTGNNVPSTDPRDLYDNAENLDKLVNGADPFYADRLGKLRESWAGMVNSFTNAQEGRETAFTASQADKEGRFNDFLAASGYVSLGSYGPGILFTEYNQYVAFGGQFYRPAAATSLPFTTTGIWATDEPSLVLLGDDVLRQDLANSVDPTKGAGMIGLPSGGNVRQAVNYVTPQMFGVTSDGVTDYTENLREMHDYANANGLCVSYAGIYVCKIQNGAQIEVNTDVDFAGCVFEVLNGIVVTPTHDTFLPLFIVTEGAARVTETFALTASELTKWQTKVTVPSTVKQGLLVLTTDKRIGNRTSEPGINLFYSQAFYVQKGGMLDAPLGADLTSNVVTATYYQDPERWIEITGFSADDSTFNNATMISVRRNCVKLNGVAMLPNADPGQVNVNYLFVFIRCANVVFENAAIQAQTSISSRSTYGINMSNVAAMTFRKVKGIGLNTWGVTGGNNVNSTDFIDCELNRIDAHDGAHNLTVRGGKYYDYVFNIGWGSGIFRAEEFISKGRGQFFNARPDFDNNFFGGSLVIRDVDVFPTLTDVPAGDVWSFQMIQCGSMGGEFDVEFFDTIEVSDVRYHYKKPTSGRLVAIVLQSIKEAGSLKVYGWSKFVIRDITADCPFQVSLNATLGTFSRKTSEYTDLVFSGIRSIPRQGGLSFVNDNTATASYPADAMLVNFKFISCEGVTFYSGIPSAIVHISNSSVAGLRAVAGATPTNTNVLVTDCRMTNTITVGGGSNQGDIETTGDVEVLGLRVYNTARLAGATILQGVRAKVGVTVTLPVGATMATAYTGYKSAAWQ